MIYKSTYAYTYFCIHSLAESYLLEESSSAGANAKMLMTAVAYVLLCNVHCHDLGTVQLNML